MMLYRRDASFWANSKAQSHVAWHAMGPHKNKLGAPTAACDIRIMLLDEDCGGGMELDDVPAVMRCKRAACELAMVRDVPKLRCGYPLPCPHHTLIIDRGAVTVPEHAPARAVSPARKIAKALK
jgi:hypothetical protein